MGQSKCPSCGALASNLKNCEYCGSFLVQYMAAGIGARSEKISTAEAFIFPGLLEALKFNIRSQALFPDSCPVTDIAVINNDGVQPYVNGEIVLQVADNELYDANTSPIGIAIDIPMQAGNPESERFIDSEFFPLFKLKRQDGYAEDTTFKERFLYNLGGNGKRAARAEQQKRIDSTPSEMDCYLDFGKDVEGAARFISRLLIEHYGFTNSAEFKYVTWDSEIGVFPSGESHAGGATIQASDGNIDIKNSDDSIDIKKYANWLGMGFLAYIGLKILGLF